MEQSVVQWVLYDDKLREYAGKSKTLRQEKDKMSQSILDHLKIPDGTDKLGLPQFTIDSLDTRVLCHRSKSYEPLNYKFLRECLQDYFQDKHGEPIVITDDIIQYIRTKRKTDTKIILKRDTPKPSAIDGMVSSDPSV
jgi:hypothetical protein